MMFPQRVRDSAVVLFIALALAAVVLLAEAVAADSTEYVIMSRETYELVLKTLKECAGHRI